MPWLADGSTTGSNTLERQKGFIADALRTISSIDRESAALILSFPWVAVEDIASHELAVIGLISDMMEEHPDLAREVLGFRWVRDDMTMVESQVLWGIRDLARNNLALAWQVIKEPFMEPPILQRVEYALRALFYWSLTGLPSGIVVSGAGVDVGSDVRVDFNDGGSEGLALLAQLATKSWFNDGLDDDDAALLHAINDNSGDLRQALIETPYVSSASVTLPYSGVVGLAVVRHTPFPPDDDTLATLEEGVRVIEDFMGAPLPVGDVILLVVEPDFWTLEGRAQNAIFCAGGGNVDPCYMTSIVRALNFESGPPKGAIYHELGHYYLVNGPRWLTEGLAEFLEAYTVAQTSGGELEGRLAYLESSGRCAENIWQHVNPYRGGRCDYEVGEKFLLGMYAALGPEAVSLALRELYTQSLLFEDPNHDSIYYAFLSNAPPGKEEAFRNAYQRYHGGPIRSPGTDSPEFAPLMALYNATNGEHWVNNRNWGSDAPLGAWHGVHTNSIGQITGLELADNGLVGEISSELGSLSNLIGLILNENQLTGEIPSELGDLINLANLNLPWNQLSGAIPPELGNLTNLKSLWLHGNQLNGEIPSELGNLTNLTTWWLHENNLSGELPPELANLTKLEGLLLYGNRFTGCIAAELPEIWVEKTGLERCKAAGGASP